MTESQERHLAGIKQYFLVAVDAKYKRGAEEHGCDIRCYDPLHILDEAIAENIDQFTYLVTLRDSLLRRFSKERDEA